MKLLTIILLFLSFNASALDKWNAPISFFNNISKVIKSESLTPSNLVFLKNKSYELPKLIYNNENKTIDLETAKPSRLNLLETLSILNLPAEEQKKLNDIVVDKIVIISFEYSSGNCFECKNRINNLLSYNDDIHVVLIEIDTQEKKLTKL